MFLSLTARLLLSLSLSFSAGSGPVTGVVVDSSGRPVPRAVVRVMTRDGAQAASIFTEADGTFTVSSAPDGCRLQASLSGFQPATGECRTDAPVKLTLGIAPVAEHIVVSATRTEAPAGQVATSVTVFDADEIARRQEPPLADLLRSAPGTTVVRTGGPGTVTSLFVRAGESNYTKVLLDGIPLNEPGGAFNLSNITTENLERVEFLRGANSALYGSDAMTGVIQLITRRGTRARPEGRLAFEGGSFSTARGSAGVSAKAGRFDYSADVTGFTTDNEAPNNEFRNTTLSGSAGGALGHGATLRFVGRAELGKTGTPGQTAFGRPDLDAFYKRHDGAWGTSFDQNVGAFHQHAAYGLAISHQASTNLLLDPPYTPSFEGRTAPFQFSDFAFDSRTDLRRHRASYQADGTFSTASRGHARGDGAGRLGRRAGDAERRARGHGSAGVARQRRRHAAAPGALGARVRHRRRPLRAQRELRQRDRAQDRGRVLRAHRRGRRGRHADQRELRPRHQGADDQPVVQPQSVLPRQSGSAAREGAHGRSGCRAAAGQGSPAG